MKFGKLQLFAALLLLLIAPFFFYKLNWIIHAKKTMGLVGFTGKEYSGQIVREYSVVSFFVNGNRTWFNCSNNVIFEPGQQLPVLFQPANPTNAKVDIFTEIWGDTIVYSGIPLLILLVIFLHPHIIPGNSRYQLTTRWPFVWAIDQKHRGS